MLWDEPKIFFLERRYFFSIILSEFLKNRVALQPEQMDDFDDDLFESLVEKIIAESQTEIRFRLYGGLELRERLEVAVR